MAKKQTTIYDIATALGISAATVSRCFRSPELVNAATRQRVLETAEHLGYRPNGLARGLIGGTSSALGIMVPDIHNPSFAEIIGGIEEAAYQHGFALLFGNAQENVAKEQRLFEVFLSYQVAGIILLSPRTPDLELQHWIGAGVPLVLVNRRLTLARCDVVTVDHVGLARMAVEHLTGVGRRSILYLAGPHAAQANHLRAEAARQAAAENGVGLHVIDSEVLPVTVTSERLMQQLDLLPQFDAVLAYNDLMALGAMHALTAQGIAIPEQVSVCGFDNVSWGEFSTPPLTSMAQPLKRLGEEAFSALERRMETPSEEPLEVVLPGWLVVRGSTRPDSTPQRPTAGEKWRSESLRP